MNPDLQCPYNLCVGEGRIDRILVPGQLVIITLLPTDTAKAMKSFIGDFWLHYTDSLVGTDPKKKHMLQSSPKNLNGCKIICQFIPGSVDPGMSRTVGSLVVSVESLTVG
jgi:hypothetical protein